MVTIDLAIRHQPSAILTAAAFSALTVAARLVVATARLRGCAGAVVSSAGGRAALWGRLRRR